MINKKVASVFTLREVCKWSADMETEFRYVDVETVYVSYNGSTKTLNQTLELPTQVAKDLVAKMEGKKNVNLS